MRGAGGMEWSGYEVVWSGGGILTLEEWVESDLAIRGITAREASTRGRSVESLRSISGTDDRWDGTTGQFGERWRVSRDF